MIYGIGTDITEIDRFENLSEAFLRKIYTDAEICLIGGKANSLAGNFAAKEAVAKALGTGFRGFSPSDIEILRSDAGKPEVNLYGKAAELFKQQGCTVIHVSISHGRQNACAFAVIEGED